jgi:arylsulfatase A-like enzyme
MLVGGGFSQREQRRRADVTQSRHNDRAGRIGGLVDVRQATPPPRFEVKAPEGAPNVLLVLVDDLGFAGTSAFGGPVPTPNFDRVAAEGLRYNNFHTTAVCSPTRAALKSGRNHHVNNMGAIIETGTAFPGNTGQIPSNVAPVAEMLRLNGYATAAFGKWHETAAWEASVAGPFDRWPTRQGFDKFYGFLGGETNQWAPFIYDGTHQVELPEDPDYHFLTDMTDQSVAWLRYQKALTPDKPFFIYYAPGAVHAPHHVPADWIARWKGKFDQGWDAMRDQILARQIELGVVPTGTKLAPKPEAIPDWDSLSGDEKRLFARQAEVFAAFVEMTDHEIGRVIDAIEQTGQLDNTLVILVYGDNGTSAEGGRNGMFSEMTYFNGVQEKVPDMLKFIDKWGGPETYPHMAAGWAVMFDTPYTWTKQVASDHGGTKVGMAVRWPKGIRSKGELRTQFHHVIDVAPTILEAAGLPEPKVVNGVPQRPMDGVSMAYSFEDAKAKERHVTQYFEMFGNRAIYHDGWFARTIHKAPWESKPRRPLDDDSAWELYDTTKDFSLVNNLAAQHPEKLKQLQTLFLKEAEEQRPADRRPRLRAGERGTGRSPRSDGRTHLDHAGRRHDRHVGERLSEHQEQVQDDHRRDRGHRRHGRQRHHHRPGRTLRRLVAVCQGRRTRLPLQFPGPRTIPHRCRGKTPDRQIHPPLRVCLRRRRFGKGGTGTLFINDKQVGAGRIERTQPMIFSADETADVGIDLATPVVEAIGSERNRNSPAASRV